MPSLSEPEKLKECPTVRQGTDGDWLLERRELLRMSLPDIACATRTALDDVALAVEVFFTVPTGGNALINFATPTDPTDPAWAQGNQIVCDIIASFTGVEGLYSRSLSSATSEIP